MSRLLNVNLFDSTQSSGGHIVQPMSVGKYKEVLVAKKGPSAYETGGVPLAATELGLTWINWAEISMALSADHKAHIIYPHNNGPCEEVLVFITDLAGTEIANDVDLSAIELRIRAQGAY